MTRTSSISGTLVSRQRSPVSVAAASSLRAAFLAPLIGTVPANGRPPTTVKISGTTGSGRYSQWNGRASATRASANTWPSERRDDPDVHGTNRGALGPLGGG